MCPPPLQYVLSNITKIKEEQHKAINRFETAFIDEVEKQNALRARIQHLQLGTEEPPIDASDMKLSQNMDLHLEVGARRPPIDSCGIRDSARADCCPNQQA